ncbi:unnamed protein product [Arabis nemorensis]|uniref:Uncharacterized protein n=1 Tax=Arabis nemorensis TaxID=586526 RepID=A0A565BEX7_9BRAS|nr:unnamed protein product [Arabis nemorensis]
MEAVLVDCAQNNLRHFVYKNATSCASPLEMEKLQRFWVYCVWIPKLYFIHRQIRLIQISAAPEPESPSSVTLLLISGKNNFVGVEHGRPMLWRNKYDT